MEEEKKPEEQKLTKGQLKKLKEKQKKEREAAEAGADGGAGEAKPDASAKGKKGKDKPLNAAAAAALKKKQALQEQQAIIDAENARLKAIADAEDAEEARIAKEAKDAQDSKKKEQRDKIEEKKKAGTYMTKRQLAEHKLRQKKRAELIAAGVIKPEDVSDDDESSKQTSHVIKKDKKKNKKQNQQAQEEDQQTNNADIKTEVETKVKVETKAVKVNVNEKKEAQKDEEESDDLVDDWETADIDDLAAQIKDKEIKIETNVEEEDAVKTVEENKLVELNQLSKQDGAGLKGKKGAAEEEKPTDIFAGGSENEKAARLAKRKEENMARLKASKQKRSKESKFRCPIVCILGHVDTGKTLILDKLRRTNVQAGEAGGITQQIGATFFPPEYIAGHCKKVEKEIPIDLKLPGFLVIDTPGHESFTNLRSRGSSLCDIAILVVDLMHGLEQQTLESMELLRQKKCPFIVALNKIDRIYEWKPVEYNGVQDSLNLQATHSKKEFQDRLEKTYVAFAEQGFNSVVYWNNENIDEYISFVPTSAITGEGLPDLMTYLCKMCQTKIPNQLYEKDQFDCTVLEVKCIEGLGTTIDVVLVNGLLKVHDTIILQGFNGAIVTQVRAILTPHPLKEMRVKAEYIHHQKIKGAMGIKISAPGLENAIAGSELLRGTTQQEIEAARAEIDDNMVDIMDKYVDKSKEGVCVQASTIGSLEALLEFLKTSKISVCNISIGPVHKKDVMKAMKALALDEKHTKKEFATILAFDVRVTPEAAAFAEAEGIKVFTAEIIYHLFDEFTAYVKACQDERKNTGGTDAVFPCMLEVVKDAVYNRKAPIILGVTVTAGQLKLGTLLVVPEKDNLKIGVVESIEQNRKSVTKVTAKDGAVAVRIGGQSHINFGQHFDDTNQICSWITRKSIDSLKNYYRDEMSMDDWRLVKQLKIKFNID